MSVERSAIIPIIDIDSTIAGGVVRAHMMTYNSAFPLGMTQEEIDGLEQNPEIKKTFDVPQIIALRAQGEDAEIRFQEVRASIRTSDDVHRNLTPIPGSQEGVEMIREVYGDVRYYSVRPKEVENPTRWWLTEHNFPNPGNLVICTSPQDKMFKILRDHVLKRGDSGVNVPENTTAVLWDDSYKELIAAAGRLAEQYSVIRRALGGLVVVGFGADVNTQHGEPKVRVINQPRWGSLQVSQTIGALKR